MEWKVFMIRPWLKWDSNSGPSSECLLEFDTRSKPLSHHGWMVFEKILIYSSGSSFWTRWPTSCCYLESWSLLEGLEWHLSTFSVVSCPLLLCINYFCMYKKRLSSSIIFMKNKGYVLTGWSVQRIGLDVVVGGELPPSPSLSTHISAPSAY